MKKLFPLDSGFENLFVLSRLCDKPRRREVGTYRTLEVMGPEHEFSVVDDKLAVLPIVDRVIRDFCGKIVNFVEQSGFTFGKELQLHVMEVKANFPFKSPELFEETMQNAVIKILEFLHKRYHANLLGGGMHPLLNLDGTGVWPHRHRKIYEEYGKIFKLRRHGWLNIQSFHLNLPYANETEGIKLHNLMAGLCAYLPAICASSPVYESHFGPNVDNRLLFYKENQREVPSVTGDVIPEYIHSFGEYKRDVIGKFSQDLATAGAGKTLLFKEWVNSRGLIFRFDRKAIEIRVMDEQECVKSDVALSCFIRATVRGLMAEGAELLPHKILIGDLNKVIADGLNAKVEHPQGKSARRVCQHYLDIAMTNANEDEKRYLWLVKERIEKGNLSDLIRSRILAKAKKTDFVEAVRSVYLPLIGCLADNKPYH